MPYVPSTTVLVCTGVPFDSTYRDVRLFESEGEQIAYFKSKAKYTCETYSYQRVNSSVAEPRGPLTCRVKILADDIYDCNYIAFQNENFGSKWFYAFVRQMNYINPNCTEIVYELDIWNTWLFDWTFLPSYVLREHTLNDTMYGNMQPEPFQQPPAEITGLIGEWHHPKPFYINIGVDSEVTGGKAAQGRMLQNIYTGVEWHSFLATDAGASQANDFLRQFSDQEDWHNHVVGIYMSVINYETSAESGDAPYADVELQMVPTAFNGYTPHNKKVYNYPNAYFEVSNNENQVKQYKFEDFCDFSVNTETGESIVTPNNPHFAVYMLTGAPDKVIAVPTNRFHYSSQQGANANLDDTIEINGFPQCAWVGDAYAAWFGSAVNSVWKILPDTISVVTDVLQGTALDGSDQAANLISSGANFLTDMGKHLRYQGELHGRPNAPYTSMQIGFVGFTFKAFGAIPEYAMKIDSFYDRYGYATNMLKVPNMRGRESWNYVKTRECTIIGSLPVQAMNRLRRIFDDGVWLWHTDAVGNYGLSNRIIGGENNG